MCATPLPLAPSPLAQPLSRDPQGIAAAESIGIALHPVGTLTRQRVTQSDVARVAGVHNTTVSLSLRNCPSIPEATRKRIRAIADEMGYYPDPALQALVAYRKGLLPNRPRETLAYMTNWGTRWGWRALPAHERAYVGAQGKAAELGYQLEHFWLGEPGMNQRRMSNMFFHRGITGVLIAAHRDAGDELAEIDWSRLSAVKIGCSPRGPALHRVVDDWGGMAGLAMRRIRAAGYERVGFVMEPCWDESADRAWSSGFLIEQSNLASGKRVPIFRLARSRLDQASRPPFQQCLGQLAALERWIQEHRPEVVLGYSPTVLGMLEALHLSVPRDVAYVDLCLERVDPGFAGVRQNGEIAGEVATAMLVGQLQHNLCGTAAVGTSTMVDGTWVDGATLPMAKAARCVEGLGSSARMFEGSLLAPT
jgi:LacI family transcriptional regulator